MAIAFDAATETVVIPSLGNFNHTPVGTPKGVLVFIVHAAAADVVDGVSYGGVAMTELTGSPRQKGSGEAATIFAYFLGDSIPTGTQAVTTSGSGAVTVSICVITFTATGDTEVHALDSSSINSDSVADPSFTFGCGGADTVVAMGLFSGQGAVGGITPLTNWTSRAERDFGPNVAGYYTYDIVDDVNVTAGWTQTTDDALAFLVAVKEAATVYEQAVSGAAGSVSGSLSRSTSRGLTGTTGALSAALNKLTARALSGSTGGLSGSAGRSLAATLAGAISVISGSIFARLRTKALPPPFPRGSAAGKVKQTGTLAPRSDEPSPPTGSAGGSA